MTTKLKNLFIIVCLLILSSCNDDIDLNKKVIEIDFADTGTTIDSNGNIDSIQSLKLAIAAMTSPKETYIYYHELIEYISDKLGLPIEFSQKKTYSEVNNLLKTGKIDIAFICSGAYIAAEGKIQLDNIVIPVINNSYYYYSYIITHKDYNINSFADLKGKSFAFTDPLSNTGYVYAHYRVKEMGYSHLNYFSNTIFTNAHDHSIQAVARKIVHGACVHSTIFNYIKIKYPERVKNLKIIEVSEPFGMPPIVVKVSLNTKIKERIKTILVNMNNNKKGMRILKNLLIDRYVDSDSTDYSSVRICIESLKK